MYFLDTNTCIYFLAGRSESIKQKVLSTSPSDIAIPVVVKAELLLGAQKSKNPEATLEKVLRFLEPFEIMALDDGVSPHYAEIRANLELSGNPIGLNDLIIADIQVVWHFQFSLRNTDTFIPQP